MRIGHWVFRLAMLCLLSYGLLYFAYKYGDGGADFGRYYPMYLHPFDFHVAQSPFVYRQLSAVATWLVYRAHIYYPNHIAFHDPRYDQRVLFAAMFANWWAVIAAAFFTTLAVERRLGRRPSLVPLISGLLLLLSFELQFDLITGLTDALSWALIAACFYFWNRRSPAALGLLLAASILQREVLPLVFVVFAVVEMARRRRPDRFQLGTAAWGMACFAAYLVLRRWIVPVPGYEEQLSLPAQLSTLARFHLSGDFLFQALLSQNLLFVYLLFCLLLWLRARRLERYLPHLLAAFAVLAAIGIGTGIGNNVGRVAALLTPIVVAELTLAAVELEQRLGQEPPPARD
jgi:hypothetical protein